MRRRPGMLVAFAAGLVFVAAPALAAEEPGTAPIGWAFRWLNFLLVFGGAGYLLWKYAPGYFRARADEIFSAIERARRLETEAKAVLRNAEEKLAHFEREAEEMRAAARRDALAEAERIRALAREEAERIGRAAEDEIAAAWRAARLALRAAAAQLATERAEALLREQMNRETDARIFRFLVDSLPRSAN
jgi:F0F1-type ATP synthase membrane subunit b/b'